MAGNSQVDLCFPGLSFVDNGGTFEDQDSFCLAFFFSFLVDTES